MADTYVTEQGWTVSYAPVDLSSRQEFGASRFRWLSSIYIHSSDPEAYEFIGHKGMKAMRSTGLVVIPGNGKAYMQVTRDRDEVFHEGGIEEFLDRFFGGDIGSQEIRLFKLVEAGSDSGILSYHPHDVVEPLKDAEVGDSCRIVVKRSERLWFHTLPDYRRA